MTPWSARRGQSGLTLIELLLVVSLGTIVLMPLFGLVHQTLVQKEETVVSNEANAQFRVWRAAITRDWAQAAVIRVGDPSTMSDDEKRIRECTHGNLSARVTPNIGPHIAIATSSRVAANARRVIYNTRPNPEGRGVDVIRRICGHRTEVRGGITYWTNGSSVSVDGGQEVIVSGIRSLTFPGTCSDNTAMAPPAPPCDMNVTLTGLDGQTTTIRLYQHTGRES